MNGGTGGAGFGTIDSTLYVYSGRSMVFTARVGWVSIEQRSGRPPTEP